jgi:hypothetical protein
MLDLNAIIREHIQMNEAQKKTAMDYLGAYVAAGNADLHFEQTIKIEFGGNMGRFDVTPNQIMGNADAKRAYLAKVSADHECARLLYIMRESGASLADLDPSELEG